MTRRREQVLGWVAVAGQAALLAVLARPGRRGRHPVALVRVGWALSLAGLLPLAAGSRDLGGALTPTPVPRTGSTPVDTGVFARVRHPLYSGLLLVAAGRVASAGAGRVPWAVALALLLWAKATWEERLLIRDHPGYSAYRDAVPMFVPTRSSSITSTRRCRRFRGATRPNPVHDPV